MKKVSTVAAKATRNFSNQKLTMGLDLGDDLTPTGLLMEGDYTQYKKAPTLRYVVSSRTTTYRKGAPS
jgi:hypothetical protein